MAFASLITDKESALVTLHRLACFGLFQLHDVSRDDDSLLNSEPIKECKRRLLEIQRLERIVLSLKESMQTYQVGLDHGNDGSEDQNPMPEMDHAPPGYFQELANHLEAGQRELQTQEAIRASLQEEAVGFLKELWVLRVMQAVDQAMDTQGNVRIDRWLALHPQDPGHDSAGDFGEDPEDFESHLGEPRFVSPAVYGAVSKTLPLRNRGNSSAAGDAAEGVIHDVENPRVDPERLRSHRRVIYGLVKPSRLNILRILLWRLTHGNCIITSEPVPEMIPGEEKPMQAFWVTFAGLEVRSGSQPIVEHPYPSFQSSPDLGLDRRQLIQELLPKWEQVMQHVGAFVVDYPRSGPLQRRSELLAALQDREQLLANMDSHIRRILLRFTEHPESPQLNLPRAWRLLQREKIALDGFRKCDVREDSNFVRIQGWLPASEMELFSEVVGVDLEVLSSFGKPSLGPNDSLSSFPETSEHSSSDFQGFSDDPEIPSSSSVESLSRSQSSQRSRNTSPQQPFLSGHLLSRSERPPTARKPPTFFRTNKFTHSFQALVDTYGVPSYGEINPGLFTIVTFPFLFGVMFGDIGHGILMLLGVAYLIKREDHLESLQRAGKLDEILSMAFSGRYMILMMAFFAVFCGSIYNDVMATPIPLFSSGWGFDGEDGMTGFFSGRVYPWGVDPNWYHTKNQLTFMNSLKMKLSVIFGVVHMSFGLCLAFGNHRHRRDRITVWLDWLPRFLFLLSTFGYMCFLIILKWSMDWSGIAENPRDPRAPPSLVQTMVNMFLSPSLSLDPEKQMFSGQGILQSFLLLLAVVCVPVMLFAGPLVTRKQFSFSLCPHPQTEPPGLAHLLLLGAFGWFRIRDAQDRNDHFLLPLDSSESPTQPRDDVQHGVVRKTLSPPAGQEESKSFEAGVDLRNHRGLSQESEGEEEEAGEETHLLQGSHSFSASSHQEPLNDELQDIQSTEFLDPKDPQTWEDYDFGEHLILQGIHTIEFVLGCVSNTASYLRLWALSLAHAQLSEVFWEKLIVEYGFGTGNPIVIFVTTTVWILATVGVLMCMDALECFLHSLRLHWVEFQSKFFEAQGYRFQPIVFEDIPLRCVESLQSTGPKT